MVASAIFITDLVGKCIISRNYRGDISLSKMIEIFSKYLREVDDDVKKPVFHVDYCGNIVLDHNVGSTGSGGESFVYIQTTLVPWRKSQSVIILYAFMSYLMKLWIMGYHSLLIRQFFAPLSHRRETVC